MTDSTLLNEDVKRIKALRNYYRRHFTNGASDEAFLTWIEAHLEKIREEEK